MNQYYGIGTGAVIAVGVISGLGYYIYRTKKGKATAGLGKASGEVNTIPNRGPRPLLLINPLSLTSLIWIKSLLYYKNGQEEHSKRFVSSGVISVLAVGYSMLGKKRLHMTPPSIQKFDLEDTGKLVAIVAASEMTREYLIKQKILPDHINV